MAVNDRKALQAIYVDDRVKDYVVRLVHATRRPQEYELQLEGLLQYGASPRATLSLVAAASPNPDAHPRSHVHVALNRPIPRRARHERGYMNGVSCL